VSTETVSPTGVDIHPTWKLGYAVYLVSLKNGGAAVAVAVDGEDESLSQNAPTISANGPQLHQDRSKA
jgi:hypothetical protein